jgi:predicted nucleic acid-binding protein
MKVLVDTSYWSLALRRTQETKESARAKAVLLDLIEDLRVVVIGPIRQELLSGISAQNRFDALKYRLNAFIDLELSTKDYELAAEYFNTCKTHGIQGSHIDFLICAVAVRNGLAILTLDKDFEHYAHCLPIISWRASD